MNQTIILRAQNDGLPRLEENGKDFRSFIVKHINDESESDKILRDILPDKDRNPVILILDNSHLRDWLPLLRKNWPKAFLAIYFGPNVAPFNSGDQHLLTKADFICLCKEDYRSFFEKPLLMRAGGPICVSYPVMPADLPMLKRPHIKDKLCRFFHEKKLLLFIELNENRERILMELDYLENKLKNDRAYFRDHCMCIIESKTPGLLDENVDVILDRIHKINEANSDLGKVVSYFSGNISFDTYAALMEIAEIVGYWYSFQGIFDFNLPEMAFLKCADHSSLNFIGQKNNDGKILLNFQDLQQLSALIENKIKEGYGADYFHSIVHKELTHLSLKAFELKAFEIFDMRKRSLPEFMKEKDKINWKNLYKQSKKRLFLLDYDGTLKEHVGNFNDACPDKSLMDLLLKLQQDPQNTVAIVSGRRHSTLEEWFYQFPIELVGEHGAWYRKYNENEWHLQKGLSGEWKQSLLIVLQYYTDLTPGSFIEEKDFTLTWHYRKSEQLLGLRNARELLRTLELLTAEAPLSLLDGDKIVEIKCNNVNKGVGINRFLQADTYDFIFAAGDDQTDEDMFVPLIGRKNSLKIRVRDRVISYADFFLDDHNAIRELLGYFVEK